MRILLDSSRWVFLFIRMSSLSWYDDSSYFCLIGSLVLILEPPVIEPPTFTTWPSRVIILYLLFITLLILLALLILSTRITLPNKF